MAASCHTILAGPMSPKPASMWDAPGCGGLPVSVGRLTRFNMQRRWRQAGIHEAKAKPGPYGLSLSCQPSLGFQKALAPQQNL